MGLRLHPDVRWCIAGGRIVLFDLRADRCFCLHDTVDAAFQRLTHSPALPDIDIASLQPLLARGILSACPELVTLPPQDSLPTVQTSALDVPLPAASRLASVEAWATQIQAGVKLSYFPFLRILNIIKRRKGRRAMQAFQTSGDLPRDLSAYLRSRRAISVQDKCLRTSVGLIDFLARRDCFPCLVIGVRMYPFASHAWVQDGLMVLNDTVDQVAPYTPIVVI